MKSNKQGKNLTESDFVSMSDRELARYFFDNPGDKRAVDAIAERPKTIPLDFMPEQQPQQPYPGELDQPDPELDF